MANICPICGLKTLHSVIDRATVDTSNIVDYVASSSQLNANIQNSLQNMINNVKDAPIKAELVKISSDVIHLSSKLTKVEVSLSQIINSYEQKTTKNSELIKSLQSKISKYKSLALHKENDQYEINDQNRQLISTLEKLKAEQQSKDQKYNLMKEKLKKYKNLVEESKTEISQDLMQPIDDLNHQISKLKIKIANITSENDRIMLENQQLSRQLAAKSNEIQSQNEEIENLKNNAKKSNKVLFSEVSFELKNPFTGDVDEKFQRIIAMEHFEFPQRVQMIINESARKIKSLEDTIIELKTQICDQNNKIKGYDKALSDTKNVLNVHLTQLRKLEDNEKIFDMKKLDVDKNLLAFIAKNISDDNSMGDVSKLVANLTNKDDVACSLVSSLLLANMKQQEQLQRMVDQVEQREEILQSIREIGVPPEKAAKIVLKMQEEIDNLKKTVKENEQIIQTNKVEFENLEEQLEKLGEEKTKLTENLFNTENVLSDFRTKNNELQKELENRITESDNMKKEYTVVKDQNKDLQTEIASQKKLYEVLSNESEELKSALALKKKEFADLDVRMRTAREAVKAKVEDHQQRLKDLEEEHCIKMCQMKKNYQNELDAAVAEAATIKECSYKALDASYNQTSSLKGALNDAVMKYEKAKIQNEDLERENEVLKIQNNKLQQKVSDLRARVAVLNDTAKCDCFKGNLNEQTAKHFADCACRASALKERQRVMNYVAREIGQPYKVDYFEPDEENDFHSFIRNVKEDLRKLRVFQSAKPSN